jgi:hypothetical protein
MGRSVKAGNAHFTVSIDGAEKAFASLQRKLGGFAAGLAKTGGALFAAGGAGVSAILGAAAVFSDAGDAVEKMAARTGASAEAVSALKYAADASGTSIEAIEKGFIGMAKTMTAAEKGSAGAVEALDDLGLTVEDLQGLRPEDQFSLIAERVSQVEDPSRRAALAMKVLGKSGQQLLPLFSDGADGIAALTKEAQDLGLVLSTEDAAAAAQLNDAIGRVSSQVVAFATKIGAAVAGPLTGLLNWTTQFLSKGLKWIEENRAIVRTVLAVAAGVAAAGGALIAAGAGVQALAFIAGGLATGLSAVAAAAAFLVSPIGLVAAGVLAAAGYFAMFTEAGRSMVDGAMEYFGALGEIAGATFGGIRDALARGDITAAASVLWAGLQVLWLRGTQPLREVWIGFTKFFADTWDAAVIGAAEWWNFLTGSIERGWSESLGFVQDTWSVVYAGLATGLNSLVAFFETTWLRIKELFGSDVAADLERVNKELEAANDRVAQGRDSAISGRESDREASLRASRERQKGVADALKQDLESRFAENEAAADDSLAAAEAKLAEAKAALSSIASEQAVKTAEAAEKAAQEGAAKTAPGLKIAAKSAKAGDSGAGTFSAAAIASLLRVGGDKESERTAEATERTAEATETIAKKLGQPITAGA